MAVIKPLSREDADPAVSEIYEQMSQKFGRMPNIFGLLAHRPEVLKTFLPFYQAVVAGGTVEPRYKELVYLKTSQVNGCEY